MSEEEIRDIQIVALEFGIVKNPYMDQIKAIASKYKQRIKLKKWSI